MGSPLDSSSDSVLATDQRHMRRALGLAREAMELGEVPIGCVIVGPDGSVVGEGGNRRETEGAALGHAEIAAIQAANRALGKWRLERCTLYVTLEPCIMCAGAISQARIDRVVFGVYDPKAGAVRSLYSVFDDPRLNHRVRYSVGVESEACAALLSEFFASLRRRPPRQRRNGEKDRA